MKSQRVVLNNMLLSVTWERHFEHFEIRAAFKQAGVTSQMRWDSTPGTDTV